MLPDTNPDIIHSVTSLGSSALNVIENGDDPASVRAAQILTEQTLRSIRANLTEVEQDDLLVLLASLLAGVITDGAGTGNAVEYWINLVSDVYDEFGLASEDPVFASPEETDEADRYVEFLKSL